MKQNVSECEFIDAFKRIRPDNFSYNGLEALYDYLTQLEDDIGEELELDVIAFCCDYSEYENLKEFQKDYGDEYKSIEDIEEQTTVIKIDDESFIIQVF